MRKILISAFIAGYLVFSFQSSVFPLMGLPEKSVWPWFSWGMFQYSLRHNETLAATGTTEEGEKVRIDLDGMFRHVSAGHEPTLLIYFDEMFSPFGRDNGIKNRFCEYVASRHNRVAAGARERVKAIQLHVEIWPKNAGDAKKQLKHRLTHLWHR